MNTNSQKHSTHSSYMIPRRHRLNKRLPVFGLLDLDFYRESNPDLSQIPNILSHFLHHGIYEMRNPNRFLDLKEAVSRLNASPQDIISSPRMTDIAAVGDIFDSEFYRSAYKDLLQDYNYSALAHYLEHGMNEGLKTTATSIFINIPPLDLLKPREINLSTYADLSDDENVLILVPVYRGVEATRACLTSLATAKLSAQCRVLVINDCSPEAEMRRVLVDICAKYNYSYNENTENLGFVRTVNLGAKQRSTKEHLLILNADTQVPPYFLQRMLHCLRSGDKQIATVTPMSNNATICTVPCISEGVPLTQDIATVEFDRACMYSSKMTGRSCVQIPTGIGFAMLINSSYLDSYADHLFNYDLFGAGYGEEVDFCLQAQAVGWSHVAATNTFVFHKGGESFKEEKVSRIDKASKIINFKYPNYNTIVSNWCQRDPIINERILTILYLSRNKNIKTRLIIAHSHGGGTQEYINQSINENPQDLFVTIIKTSTSIERINLRAKDFSFHLDISSHLNVFDTIELLFKVNVIEIHSLLDLRTDELYNFIRTSDAQLIIYIHDFSFVCPKLFMINKDYRFCGAPTDQDTCRQCLSDDALPINIDAYRLQHLEAVCKHY